MAICAFYTIELNLIEISTKRISGRDWAHLRNCPQSSGTLHALNWCLKTQHAAEMPWRCKKVLNRNMNRKKEVLKRRFIPTFQDLFFSHSITPATCGFQAKTVSPGALLP